MPSEETTQSLHQPDPARAKPAGALAQPEPPGRRRICLFVLGMHRSGTSSIAGTLIKLGATGPKDIFGSAGGNETGHWESEPLMHFHNELLASAGSRWDDWREFNKDWSASPMAAHYQARAKQLLRDQFGDSPLFVFKDPRNCRFASFWFEIFAEEGIEPRIVIPVRSPLEVARSHQARDRFPVRKGLLLWLRHVLDAEAVSRDFPRVVVEWSVFLSDWQSTVGRLEHVIGHMPAKSDLTAAEIDRFLDRDLKHHRVTDEELAQNALIHDWVADAYVALSELARNPGSNSARATLDRVRAQFDHAARLFGGVLADADASLADLAANLKQAEAAHEQLAARLETMRSDHQAEIARIEAERLNENNAFELAIAESRQLSPQLQDELRSARAELDALRVALTGTEGDPGQEGVSLVEEVSKISATLSMAENRLAETQAFLQQAEAARVEELGRSQAMSEELAATRQKHEAAELAASQAHAEIDLLRASQSQAIEDREKMILDAERVRVERDAALNESLAKAEALAVLSANHSSEIEANRNELARIVDEYNSQIAAIKNSRSWRLTAPLRASRSALARIVGLTGKRADKK